MENFSAKFVCASDDYIWGGRIVKLSLPHAWVAFATMPGLFLILSFFMPAGRMILYALAFYLFWGYLIARYLVRPSFSLQKRFGDDKKSSQEIFFTIGGAGLGIVTDGITEKWPWEKFSRFVTKRDFLLFYLKASRGRAKLIPKRAFADGAELERVIEFCRARLPGKDTRR
jgi:hypothetical protein